MIVSGIFPLILNQPNIPHSGCSRDPIAVTLPGTEESYIAIEFLPGSLQGCGQALEMKEECRVPSARIIDPSTTTIIDEVVDMKEGDGIQTTIGLFHASLFITDGL
jgi:hypothetical protein